MCDFNENHCAWHSYNIYFLKKEKKQYILNESKNAM